MRITKWARKVCRAARRADAGRRTLAGLMALVMTLGLVNFVLPEAKAADAKNYEQEKADRIEAYADRFDTANLKWATSGKDAGGNTVDHGNSARTYMCWAKSDGTFGGIVHRNYIHVYAFEGETITFGSNICDSTLTAEGTAVANAKQKQEIADRLGEGATVDIVLIDLHGNRILYDVMKDGKGHIPNYQTEVLAKTMEKVTGNEGTVGIQKYTYTPLTYEVRETGVYTFEFHSQDGSGTDTDSRQTKNGVFADDTGLIKSKDCGGMVDAWDISVFNEQGYKETGRVYADYLDFQEKGDVNETYYVLTSDNYIYRWDFKKAHPYTYNFFANNQGLLEKGTDHILYKSVKDVDNGNTYDEFGITYTYPGTPDTELTKSYKIFFEMPDEDLMGQLYDKAVAPDPASNLKFVTEVWDEEKGSYIPGTYVGRGGWFQFDVENATTATLRIEFVDTNNKFGKQYAPVEISQVVTPYSTNRFFWDGRDGNGEIIPAGDYTLVDISWTITTKAGEIHFPIVDVEDTGGGFTFTRLSPVYNKDGERLDADDKTDGTPTNIYTATKSVIYYDNSAIYYGERVARAGTPESDIILDSGKPKITALQNWVDNSWDGKSKARQDYDSTRTNQFFVWRDISESTSTEYVAWTDDYRIGKGLRAGDHSHISNDITFYNTETGELVGTDVIAKQQDMIDWLDSEKHPVAKISGGSGSVVSDFSIQNFWTFVPGQPVTAKGTTEEQIVIKGIPEDKTPANITGLVFYDNDAGKTSGFDGKYNAKQTDMDVPLSGVRVNLYRQTDDTAPVSGKTYYTVEGTHGNWAIAELSGGVFPSDKTVFELVKRDTPDTTDLTGHVIFENQLYDATKGTKFAYEVIKTYPNWELTSYNTPGTPLGKDPNQYGNYALYAYDKNEKGTEVQVFTLADKDSSVSGAIDPDDNLADYENHTATAIDVGYHYTPVQSLRAVKSWKTTGTDTTTPPNVVYELSYYDKTSKNHKVYEERSLSSIMSWENVWNYLPDTIDGNKVEYYISAEYYLVKNSSGEGGGTLYRHTFELDTAASELTYSSFVGEASCRTLNSDEVAALKYGSYDSLNPGEAEWTEAEKAPYTAVLDRNPGTAETTITITNSDAPGVIQILKYTGALTDKNFLQGATFRLYTQIESGSEDISLEEVRKHIAGGEAGDLQWLTLHQVGSATTRTNGKVAFAGLDSGKHYVLREMYAPAGYRVMEELYLIHPAKCDHDEKFDPVEPGDPKYEAYQTWISQNGRFGAANPGGTDNDDENFIEFPVGNIPASGNLMVRKRIAGRAWNTEDSFEFNIAFRDKDGGEVTAFADVQNVAGFADYGINIDEGEAGIVGDDTTLVTALKNFANAFKEHTDVTVNYSSDNYVESFTIPGSTNQTVETAYPDIHQSFLLLTDGKPVEETVPGGETKYTLTDATLAHNNTLSDDATKFAGKGEKFPAAGTYTFTISENDVVGGTLSGDSVVYTVVVKVKRVMNPDSEADESNPTTANSHLEAEVTNITYQENDDDDSATSSAKYPDGYKTPQKYMGASPLFTNNYQVQPAVQTTGYAITKNFTGRLNENGQPLNSSNEDTSEKSKYDDGWLEGDHFYVTIEGADDTTKEALNAGNIYIGGLHGKRDEVHGTFDTQKVVCFNQKNVTNPRGTTSDIGEGDEVNVGHTFTFDEIDFQNLKFPTAWVYAEDGAGADGTAYKAGEPVEETDTAKVVYYAPEGEDAKYVFCSDLEAHARTGNHEGDPVVVSRTEDIVYKLEIREYKPADTKGITYSEQVYTLVITLKNAVSITTGEGNLAAAVTDGIIDELDFDLYDCAAAAITETSKPEATCTTDQVVVNSFNDWANPKFEGFDTTETDWETKWYYVNNSTTEDHPVIREATVVERQGDSTTGIPTKFSVDIPAEGSGAARTIYIVADDDPNADAADYYTFKEIAAAKLDITFIAKREGHTGDHVMTFSNTYQATGRWTPTIHKFVEGRDWGEYEEFDFTLTCTKYPGTYKPDNGDQSLTISKATSKNDNSGTFDAVTFKAPGEYTFTLSETLNHINGKLDIRDAITIKVVATDNNDGTLNLEVTGLGGSAEHPDETDNNKTNAVTSTINFVNVYSESGSFEIAIEKTLTGRDWVSGEGDESGDSFIFTVELNEAAQNAVKAGKLTVPTEWTDNKDVTYTVTITDSSAKGSGDAARRVPGTLNLSNLEAKGGEYVFTVTEKTDDFAEKTLECRQPTVKLTVTAYSDEYNEGGYNGTILTYAYFGSSTGKDDPDNLKAPYTVPFTNKYYVDTEGPSASVGEHGFTVEKEFTGRPDNKWTNGTTDDTFSATVTFSGDADLLDDFQFKNDEGEYVKWEAKHGNVTFTESEKSKTFDFRFFEEGEYKFTVKETVPEDGEKIPGVTYDENTYTVTFNVTPDTDDDNRLTVTRTIEKQDGTPVTGGNITFVNTYKAEGTWTPTVTKKLKGREWQKWETAGGTDEEKFEFTLTCTEMPDGVENPIPGGQTISIVEDNATSGVSFGAIEFTQEGEYTFTISETGTGKGIGGGSTTSAGSITIKVNAKDNGDGKMNLTVTGEDGTTTPGTASDNVATTVNFVNTYNESGDFPLSLSKLLTGRDWKDDEGDESNETFSFTITPFDSVTTTAINDELITASWITDKTATSFNVTVGETPGETNETTGWETRKLDLGDLQVGNLGGKTAAYTFIIEENTADFAEQSLYCAQPKIKLTVNVDGSALDGKLKFSATYAYIVDDSDTGTDGGTSATSLVLPFTNRCYVDTASPGTVTGEHGFSVISELTGRPEEKWLPTDTFTVNVSYTGDKDNLANMLAKAPGDEDYNEITDDKFSRSAKFTSTDYTVSKTFDFRFLEAGEYEFAVTETKGDIDGVTYDESEYTVTFNVTKKETDDHSLTVTRTITSVTGTVAVRATGDGTGAITFKNIYEAEGKWTPSVNKTLKGRDWEIGEKFAFKIECTGYTGGAAPTFTSKNVEVSETGDNTGNGSFGEVTFTKEGNYTFTITETNTGKGLGTGTAPAPVTVTVEVTDQDDGTLNVAVKNGAGTILTRPATSASYTFDFTNTYEESGSFSLAVDKTLDGRDWIETDAFTFKLEPDDTTLSAIENGELSVPASWTRVNNYYTVTSSEKYTGSGTREIELGELTVTNKADSKESVATPRVYTFTVSEETGKIENLTYDTAVKTVTVTATRKTEGGKYTGKFEFKVEVTSESDSNPSFTNRCYAGGEPQGPDADPDAVNSWFAVAKEITGREWLTTGESYKVNAVLSGDASQMEYSEDGGNTYLPMTDGKTFDFTLTGSGAVNSPIFRFYKAGTYTFTLTEEYGGSRINGVTYDDNTYTVTFDVAKTGDDNHLTVTRTIEKQDGTTVSGGTVTFTNEYAPDPAKWGPTVIKELTGRDWMEADEFKFTLTKTEEKVNPEGLEIADGGKFSITDTDVDAAGRHTVTPGLVTFNKPGTYYLTITEDSDEEYGIKVGYKFRLEVRVRDDQESGKLVVDSISSETDPNVNLAHPGIMFRNVYSEQGKFDITLIKFLNGRALTASDVFTFTVTPDPDTKEAIDSGIVTVPTGFVKDPTDDGTYTVTVTGKDAGSGYAMSELGELSVKRNTYIGEKITYGFVIKEVGLPENTRPVQAELHVQMTMSETIDETTGLPTGGIEMTYAYILPDDSTLPVNRTTVYLPFENYAYTEAEFSVEKTFRDNNWPEGKEFSAEVTLTSGNGDNVRHKDMTVLPEGGETLTFTKTNPAETLSYVFLAPGEYAFEVRENVGTFGGVSYDDNVYTMTVTVTDDGAGHLTAKVSESTVKLVNIYMTSPAAVELTAEKIFVSDRGLKAEQFGFTLEATAGAPMPAGIVGNMLTIRNDVHGNVDFGSVEYTATGTYVYKVRELNEELPGVTYDERVYTVTVTVTDNYDGQLLADVKYTADGESADQIVFHNTRGATPDPAPVTLGIRKTVSGSYDLNAGDFAFTVMPSVSNPAGDPIGELAGWDLGTGTLTVRNGEPAGNTAPAGIFEDTLFEVAGKYVYTVVEYIPVVTDPRMNYDASIYTVTVDVAGNTKLEAAITAEKDGEAVALGDGVLDFTNIYGTAPSSDDPGISVALRAQKTLTNLAGEPVVFENGAFTFVLNPLNGAPMPRAAEATVSSNGWAVFEGITFTAEDVGKTYEYEMREEPKEADGFVCDGSVWHVTVAVTQSSDGKLAAEIIYEKDGVVRSSDQGALFENLSYEPVKLTVQKTVGGLGDKEMAFNFKVEFTLPEGFDRDLAGIARIADAPDGFTWSVDAETGAVTLEFALKHGQLVTVENLPAWIGYKVTEAEADRDGYRTYVYGAETGDLSVDGTVRFFNTIPDPNAPPPDPGDPSPDPGDPSPNPGDPSPNLGDPSPDPGDPPPDPGDPPPDPGDPPRDHDKTSDETPKTGDNSHPWLWVALMLLSLTGAVVTSFSLFGKRSIACSGKWRGVSLRGRHKRR